MPSMLRAGTTQKLVARDERRIGVDQVIEADLALFHAQPDLLGELTKRLQAHAFERIGTWRAHDPPLGEDAQIGDQDLGDRAVIPDNHRHSGLPLRIGPCHFALSPHPRAAAGRFNARIDSAGEVSVQ